MYYGTKSGLPDPNFPAECSPNYFGRLQYNKKGCRCWLRAVTIWTRRRYRGWVSKFWSGKRVTNVALYCPIRWFKSHYQSLICTYNLFLVTFTVNVKFFHSISAHVFLFYTETYIDSLRLFDTLDLTFCSCIQARSQTSAMFCTIYRTDFAHSILAIEVRICQWPGEIV